MILLDTNIVSELMKAKPDAGVIAWFNQQNTAQMFVSSVTIAELQYGLQVLPLGQKRERLEAAFQRAIGLAFYQRVLHFDEAAAYCYGRLMAKRREQGRPMSVPDGQIAAIALVQPAKLVTRNLRDFEACGLELINPFL